jgi:hypothetical protein
LKPLRFVTYSVAFELLSMAVVVANAIVLGMEKFDQPQDEVYALRIANYVLTIMFGGSWLA